MKFDRQPMVRWYNVSLLAATGMKTLVSSLFGNFADKREIQAALSDKSSFDYSDRDTCWLDYIADLGDGFDATYTMAHLLAKDSLTVAGERIPQGKLLVMGGDEVYPTPEVIEYKNRLQGPYKAAFPWREKDPDRPHLFAIPGNHDWYDGLTNFIKLFCQERAIGNWLTQQKRSYFAIKLPHRCWLWGIDVQLHADIDRPQREYFTEIVEHEMEDGDHIILCTAEPAWIFHALQRGNDSYERLQFFIDNHILLQDPRDHKEPSKKLHLMAVFSGDLHHYSRYEVEGGQGEQLITAGGGGAFTHPTHILKDEIETVNGRKADLKKIYPSHQASRGMAFRNLLFPFINREMAMMLGFIYLFIVWFLQSMAEDSVTSDLSQLAYSFENLGAVFLIINNALAQNPLGIILNLILIVGLLVFTDTAFGKGKLNWIAGVFHGVAHVINLYVLLWLFSRINFLISDWSTMAGTATWLDEWHLSSLTYTIIFVLEMMVIGSLSAGLIFGLYLMISTLVFESHPTEAFSSFRGKDFKNFLRLRVDREGVTIYPIGVKHVVTNWKNRGTREKPRFEGDAVQYELIEQPIHLKFNPHEPSVKPPEHVKTSV